MVGCSGEPGLGLGVLMAQDHVGWGREWLRPRGASTLFEEQLVRPAGARHASLETGDDLGGGRRVGGFGRRATGQFVWSREDYLFFGERAGIVGQRRAGGTRCLPRHRTVAPECGESAPLGRKAVSEAGSELTLHRFRQPGADRALAVGPTLPELTQRGQVPCRSVRRRGWTMSASGGKPCALPPIAVAARY